MAAAQNTISILETIKKKMQNFDNKVPAAAAPAAQASAAQAPTAEQKVVPAAPVTPPAPQAPVAPAAQANMDDLDFGDLDLDDETAFKAPAPAKEAPKVQAQAPAPAAPQVKHDDLDDLDLEDHDLIDEHDDLDLDRHDEKGGLDLEKHEDDDLDFSDLEGEEEPKIKAPQAQEKKPLSIDDLDNLSLEDLESDLALGSSASKPAQVQAAKPVMQAAPLVPPKPQMPPMQAPKAPPAPPKVPPVPVKTQMDDDLFEDDFEKELENFKPQLDNQAPITPSTAKAPSLMQALKKPTPVAPVVQEPVKSQPQVLAPMNYNSKASMLSEDTIRQTTDSVKKLMDAKNMVAGIKSFSQSPALAEVAIQLLEPKLEKWLNENLRHIVEDIVREEIKNIIPKE